MVGWAEKNATDPEIWDDVGQVSNFHSARLRLVCSKTLCYEMSRLSALRFIIRKYCYCGFQFEWHLLVFWLLLFREVWFWASTECWSWVHYTVITIFGTIICLKSLMLTQYIPPSDWLVWLVTNVITIWATYRCMPELTIFRSQQCAGPQWVVTNLVHMHTRRATNIGKLIF